MSETLHINVFVDALGWRIAAPRNLLPELDAVRQPVRTVLGYSSAAVPTILTGVLPRVHGQWSFYLWGPEASPFRWLRPLSVLPHRVAAHHRVRRPISAVVKRALGYTGYFNLYAAPFSRVWQWDWCEKEDLFAPGGVNGHDTIFDALDQAGVRHHRSDWRRPEDENIAAAITAAKDPRTGFVFVYLAGLDAVLHRYGHPGADRPEGAARYEDAVRRIVAAGKGAHDDVRVCVFSDHGMAEVHRVADLRRAVEATGLRYGTDYAAIYDSTMVRLWYLRPEHRPRLEQALAATGTGRFLSEQDLAASGADFPGHRYGEGIFLCDPGVLVVPSDMGLTPIAGMHGYGEDDPDSDAVLLSSHPLAAPVRRIDDLNRMMRAQVGLPPAPGATPLEEAA